MSRPFAFGLLAALLTTSAPARATSEEDPLDLIALLVRDGRYDRAEAALRDVPANGLQEEALVRRHLLEGLVLAGTGRWEEAAAAFREARVLTGPTSDDPSPWLHEARALLQAGRPSEAGAVLRTAPASALTLPTTWLLSARAAADAGDDGAAWAFLTEGAARFPDDTDLSRAQVLLLLGLGLYREAIERGAARLTRADATMEDVLVLAEALERAGDPEQAAAVVALGRLRFSDRVEAWVRSATLALARQRPVEAARDLEVAAELDPALAQEAAEVWRRAGDPARALRLNAHVPDPVVATRQRLGLLLEREAWDLAIALQERIVRLGLLDDGTVACGLAHARFRVGDLDGAEALLHHVTDPRAYELATELRSAMEACRAEPGACP